MKLKALKNKVRPSQNNKSENATDECIGEGEEDPEGEHSHQSSSEDAEDAQRGFQESSQLGRHPRQHHARTSERHNSGC